MNCKTKFENHNKQAIGYEGEGPKSSSDLNLGGEELREDPGKEEQEEKYLLDTTMDYCVTK